MRHSGSQRIRSEPGRCQRARHLLDSVSDGTRLRPQHGVQHRRPAPNVR